MQIKICHEIRYSYHKTVYCEPLTIQLRPRDDSSQRLESFRLRIKPEPAGISQYKDLHGNDVSRCWFKGFTQNLLVTTECVVSTFLNNPYNFLLAPEAVNLPLSNFSHGDSLWQYYAKPSADSDLLTRLASEILQETGGDTVGFLTQLTSRLYRECEPVIRPHGEAKSAEETWRDRSGACRDIAVLFNEICRLVGIPARFVSGYGYQEFREERHLHAWCEVYLPGAGWRGFDPTIGLAVADRHIAVASARDPVEAAPTTGTYRGTAVESSLEAHVQLERLDEVRSSMMPESEQSLATVNDNRVLVAD